ncbi:MAG: NusG domain II-containing protein [Termitinemataceae bacterium]|nr:MAG: NusG domain II-containing protein [Termitinemataceae bacterium]
MSKKKPLFLDYVFFVIAAAFCTASAVFVYAGYGHENVVIKTQNEMWVYPLDTNVTVNLAGPLGETVVQLDSNKVKIISSPCKNKSCVAAGAIHSGGDWLACLPNRVIVTIEKTKKSESLDAALW